MNNELETYIHDAYTRKSSESEDKQVQSIERQKDDIIEMVEKEGLVLYSDIIEETQSAFSPGRESFNALVKRTQQGKVNAWLCWHANRLSRNPIDAGMIIYLLDTGKLHHIKTPSKIYYNTPIDKMMLQFEFIMSKKDSDDKSLAVKSGLKKRYKKGFPTGRAPLGYLNDMTAEKGNRKWIKDEERFKKVQKLFKKYLKGEDSLNSITEYAHNVLELTTALSKRQGGILVNRSLVHHTLKNPIYAGFFYANDERGKTKNLHSLNEDVPRVISEEEHLQILNMFGEKCYTKVESHKSAYKGFIIGSDGNYIGADYKYQIICDCKNKFAYRNREVCPECEIPLFKMKNPNYLRYSYFYNVQRRKTKGLKAKCFNEQYVDNFLIDYFEKNIELPESSLVWIKQSINVLHDEELETRKVLMQKAEQELKALEKKKIKLKKLFLNEVIEYETFKSDIQDLELSIRQKTNQSEYTENWHEQIHKLFETLHNFKEIIQKGTYSDKKELLKILSSNLIWNEKNLSISNAKWLNTYIKGRKSILHEFQQFEPENLVEFKGLNCVLDVHCPSMLRWLDKIRKSYHY
jgi:site-specific DNA recombinase